MVQFGPCATREHLSGGWPHPITIAVYLSSYSGYSYQSFATVTLGSFVSVTTPGMKSQAVAGNIVGTLAQLLE
jgi:hypothetical protein